jgi:hypothetical protein
VRGEPPGEIDPGWIRECVTLAGLRRNAGDWRARKERAFGKSVDDRLRLFAVSQISIANFGSGRKPSFRHRCGGRLLHT